MKKYKIIKKLMYLALFLLATYNVIIPANLQAKFYSYFTDEYTPNSEVGTHYIQIKNIIKSKKSTEEQDYYLVEYTNGMTMLAVDKNYQYIKKVYNDRENLDKNNYYLLATVVSKYSYDSTTITTNIDKDTEFLFLMELLDYAATTSDNDKISASLETIPYRYLSSAKYRDLSGFQIIVLVFLFLVLLFKIFRTILKWTKFIKKKMTGRGKEND